MTRQWSTASAGCDSRARRGVFTRSFDVSYARSQTSRDLFQSGSAISEERIFSGSLNHFLFRGVGHEVRILVVRHRYPSLNPDVDRSMAEFEGVSPGVVLNFARDITRWG